MQNNQETGLYQNVSNRLAYKTAVKRLRLCERCNDKVAPFQGVSELS